MTESTIDTDRMMQGIDCEVITWTKCSERMPDKGKQVIVRDGQRRTDLETSDRLIEYKNFLCMLYGTNDRFNSELWEWAPYTPEVWKELNK